MKKLAPFLFFYCFIVLSTIAQEKIAKGLKDKVAIESEKLTTYATNELDPVSVNSKVVWSDNRKQLAVVVKATMLDGWHIYAYVPKTQPYISTKLELDLPKGITPIGDWEKPFSIPYDDGVYIYQDEVIFIRYCKVEKYDKNTEISSGLYYQTCDDYKCLTPETKTKNLKL